MECAQELIRALYRGFSAISGWFGAYIFPTLKQNYGLWWTAESALGFQFVCVAVAAVVTCLYAFESSHSITGIFNTSLVPFIVAFAVVRMRFYSSKNAKYTYFHIRYACALVDCIKGRLVDL